MLSSSVDDPSAEICSVQKQKASLFVSLLDVQYEQQAQLLTYAGVMSNNSILLPESRKLNRFTEDNKLIAIID